MSWYAASVIMWVKFKDGNQDCYPVWENIYLVQADSHDEARTAATAFGKAGAGDSGGSFIWDDRPAEWIFGGVRKTTTCTDPDERPSHGTEITYSEFEVATREELERLISSDAVDVRYVE